jgi:hypothetical protein
MTPRPQETSEAPGRPRLTIMTLARLVILLPLLAVLLGSVFAEAIESGHEKAAVEGLKYQEQIVKDGITWKFKEKVPVGEFVNGDLYVVGRATIVEITPQPGNGRNNSVLSLRPDPFRSGFDDRVSDNRYDRRLAARLPIDMVPGDALISSISVNAIGEIPAPLRPQDKSISPVRTVSILTCLDKPVPRDAFRPSYCDRQQKIYLARNLRRDLLPHLPQVKGGLDHKPGPLSIQEWAERFRRPWIDTCFFNFDVPIEYMPHYGREVGRAVGIASLLLMLDFPASEKENLLVNFVQYGIDLWGIVRAGHRGWPGHGGHGSGRKWPIIFAGIMLDDTDMQSPKKKYPAVEFGEDTQTMYGNGWTGANALYAGHVGKGGRLGKVGWGAYEHQHPDKWASDIGEGYRRCCTSIAWVGQALAARIMKAEKLWAHDAFFDYVDRWMTEDDEKAIEEIKEAKGWDYSAQWARQGQAWDPFVNEMWAKYRNALPVSQRSVAIGDGSGQ